MSYPYQTQTNYASDSQGQNSLGLLALISAILVLTGSGIATYVAYQNFKLTP